MKIEEFIAHIETKLNQFEKYCIEEYPEMLEEDDMNVADWWEQFDIFFEDDLI